MNLAIQKEIFEEFDKPIIGVIIAKEVDNHGARDDIDTLLRKAEAETRERFSKSESFGANPNIAAWRSAYKKFGSDPHQYRSSVESLVRRVCKDDSLPYINKLVDLYNYISLKYVVPVGGEDIDMIRGNLRLAFADGAEPFIRLNGTENEPPSTGEVVYKDDEGVICRRWNWREADRTKLTEKTKNAIIVLDALAPVDRATVEQATQELAKLITQFCGGKAKGEVLS